MSGPWHDDAGVDGTTPEQRAAILRLTKEFGPLPSDWLAALDSQVERATVAEKTLQAVTEELGLSKDHIEDIVARDALDPKHEVTP